MNKTKTYEGIIRVRGKGTGFVGLEDFLEDIVVVSENLGFALDGDLVALTLLPPVAGERRQGVVKSVLEPAHTELIGVVKAAETGGYYLHPDNHRVHVRPALPEASAADLGMKVVTTITSWSDPTQPPQAAINETLGQAGDHETEMQAIIRGGGFSENFPEPISQAANELYRTQADIFAAAEADPKRRDLRDRVTLTIDPADAKDFDDALSLKQLDNGHYEVGVHIADVSHYVRPNDLIDKEARERGTSVYLVDRVIPMLPEVLSNDLCSLRPKTDRLAFSAVFELTPEGEIANAWYGQTIIHSNQRLSYQDAQAVLDKSAGEHYAELNALQTLARKLRAKRHKAGAIAFEKPEVKFKLDEKGKPVAISVKERVETMLMIEDFMLLANREVATHVNTLCRASNQPTGFVYRVHDKPDPEKIEELATFVRALGFELTTHQGAVTAKAINQFLADIKDAPEQELLKIATIRSMAKAMYSTKNIGHFGLAFKHYTHFTSPIRRYPDLIAHRLLRRYLDGGKVSGQEMTAFEKLCLQASEQEVEATRAERDSVRYKQVEYMSERIGQEFTGLISGVTKWGLYVEEAESKCEGMVSLASIRFDYFEHLPEQYAVKGQKTGLVYRLGDTVSVKVTQADLEARQIDYQLLGER